MEINMTSPRHGAPPWRRIGQLGTVVAIATAIGMLAPMGAAFADTGAIGAGQATLTGGALAIGSATTNTIPVSLTTFTGVGLLPTAVWSDATGSGSGWNGTVAVSDFTYTGAWTTTGTALSVASSGAYTGTQNGVVYTVNFAVDTSTFTYTSTSTADPGVVATDSTAALTTGPSAVGILGITIDFGSTLPTTSTVYQLQAGTQASSALSLSSGTSGAGVVVSDSSTSADPVLVSAPTSVAGPSSSPAQGYGAAIKFVAAAANTGMGSYTVNPGVSFNADVSSWAATYTANVQYSIVTGP